ncbi:hypothetical protein BIV25_40395 [Streptomyces sp. MUSC 14]|nr:hypothetical protein BIV25_40395 [Streptomyces sp. MUSC 14]
MAECGVLACSGGLDTSVAIGWIAEETGAEDRDVIRKRALACQGRVRRRVLPPGGQGQRPLHGPLPVVSALSRPAIVKHLAAAAQQHGATTVALAPGLKCVAPVRDHAMTRDRAIAFREAERLPLSSRIAARRDLRA